MKQLQLVAAVALLIACTIIVPAQSQTGGPAPMQMPNRVLDKVAREAAPSNPDSVRALAHEVVNYPHVYSFPPEVNSILENSLTDGELKYRNHLGGGIREEQIVSLMNDLVHRLQLPEYLRTTPNQLRNLRMRLAVTTPSLMGAGLTDHDLQKGDSVNETMSPLQAFHLLCTMIDQKVLNDLYQDPTIDIVRAEKSRGDEYRRRAEAAGKHVIAEHRSNPRSLEVRLAVERAVGAMSMSDGIDLINHTLSAMGLK